MPNNGSYADLVRDADMLLRGFDDNAEKLVPAEAQRDALTESLTRMQNVKARQDSFAAQRQQSTQELVQLMHQVREDARRLRGMVKGLLGTKNERLVQFKVPPIRSKKVPAVPEIPPPPPLPPVEAVAEAAPPAES